METQADVIVAIEGAGGNPLHALLFDFRALRCGLGEGVDATCAVNV